MERIDSAPRTGMREYVARHIREYGLLFALIAIMVFFQIVTGGVLLRPVNITNLFLQNSYIIIMALWLLAGQSVGPFPQSFQQLSTGFIADPFGFDRPNGLALAVGVLSVLLILWIGLRARARNARYGIEDEPLALFLIRNGVIAAALLFVTWKLAWFRGLPNVLLSMVVLTVIYVFLTERTTIGRRVYATGGNAKAAKLSGIRTERLTFLVFVNMGLLAALAGLVFAARLNTATPRAGFAVELDVIAAVFIGGASMSGGVGKIVGAVVGAFIMGVMNNGMSIMGIGIDYQQVIKGLVLLAAVFFDVCNKNREG